MTRARFVLRRPLVQCRRAVRRLVSNRRAAVLVETAYTLPIMVTIGFGGLEIANLTLANTQMNQIALSAADNASRIASGSNLSTPQIREIDLNEVFTGAELQSGSLKLNNHGRMRLSSLQRNASGGQWIRWQRCYGTYSAPARYGTAGTGASGTGFPGMGPTGREVTAPTGGAVMFVEITYQYQPLLFSSVVPNKIITADAAFLVREAVDLTQVYNPAPAVPVRNC